MHGNLGAGPSAPVEGDRDLVDRTGPRPAADARPASAAPSVADRIRSATGAARAGGRTIVGNFRRVDFRREVWPLDERTIAAVSRQPAFWAVVLLASLPLLFVTLREGGHQLTAMAVFFAAVWGFVFRSAVVPDVRVSYRWLTACFFAAGLLSIPGLLAAYRVLPAWYVGLAGSGAASARFVGFLGQVGPCEELAKLVPVIVVSLILRRRLGHADVVMLGVAAGLGFGAFENLQYFRANIAALGLAAPAGASPQEVVTFAQGAMVEAMVRAVSTTFGHAVYSAITAHFWAAGRGAGAKRLPLWVVGVVVASVLHGMYDWLQGVQQTLSVLVNVLAFVLLKVYLTAITRERVALDNVSQSEIGIDMAAARD